MLILEDVINVLYEHGILFDDKLVESLRKLDLQQPLDVDEFYED